MAVTKLSSLRAKYNEQEKLLKEQYKNERGLKTAYGFKKTDDFKRIQKNKAAALRRYEVKSPTKAKKVAEDINDNKDNFDNISVITSGESFHTALSYGAGADRVAMNAFKLEKAGGKPVIILFDGRDIGFAPQRADNVADFSRIMKSAYQHATDYIFKNKLGSFGVLVDAVTGTYLIQKKTYLTITMYEGKLKPQP